MNPSLDQALADYLSIRRALGFKLQRAESLVGQFIAYLHKRNIDTVTVADALAWATLPADTTPLWWSYRLSAVRGFAVYLHTLDDSAQVPPPGLLRCGPHRVTPYLYSEDDIGALLRAAGGVSHPVSALTYPTLIGLLAVTGMRVGEAIRLDRDDFDASRDGRLIVRDTKFGKTRQLPLHPSTVTALSAYLHARDALLPTPTTSALLVATRGGRLRYNTAHHSPAHRGHRSPRPARNPPAPHSRPPPQLCRGHPARWVCGRRRRGGPAPAVVDLSGP